MKNLKFRKLIRIMPAAIVMLLAGLQASASIRWNPARDLTDGGWAWTRAQTFELPGAQLTLQRFQVRLTPAEAARRLSAAGSPRFTRLQFSGPHVLLSGASQGQHWLAQLQPAADGTRGMVSSLEPQALVPIGFDAARFAPAGARRVLLVSSRPAALASTLASYDCPGTLDRVAQSVHQALLSGGWQPVNGVPGQPLPSTGERALPERTAGPPAGEWARADGARLSVYLHQRAGAVALTFWHHPAEAS